MSPAISESMPTLPPSLNYLAMVIDIREERLEKTTIPFLKEQIRQELDRLLERFETEYQAYLRISGQGEPAVVLKPAA